jgi:hypothetical protein
MPKGVRRKKGAVRPGHGARCFICGMECGKGGSLKKHVELGHNVDYDLGYKRCFKGGDVVFSKVASDLSGEIVVQTRVLKVPLKQK